MSFSMSVPMTGISGYGSGSVAIADAPIRAVFDVLKARADEDGDWEVHPVALGEQPGKAVINVAELSVFSSLLPQRDAATAFDPGATHARTEEVAVATLDQFAPD